MNGKPKEKEAPKKPSVAGEAAAGVAKKGITTGVKKAGKFVVSKVAGLGLKEAISDIGAALGSVVPGIGTAIGKAIGYAVSWITEKVIGAIINWIRKHKEEAAIAALAGAGLLLGSPFLVAGGLVLGGILFFSAIVLPAVAGLAATLLASVFIAILLFAVIVFIINSGAYIVPPAPFALPGAIESPYIEVTKTPSPTGPFSNSNLPVKISYVITVRAKTGTLTNIHFSHECKVLRNGPVASCPAPLPASTPSSISPTDPFNFTYSATYSGASYQNSLVINTFTVTADAPEQAGAQSAASANITIGNPPEGCPKSWPTTGTLNQGAYTSSTHANAEAIDIGAPTGRTVSARHSGIVSAIDSWPYGKHVEIISTCGGKQFFSRYAHLSVISVTSGAAVTMGQTVGLVGSTGNSTGPHLHYEFRYPSGPTRYPDLPPFLMPPFVDKPLPRGCVGYAACGNVNIP